jgi:anti-sigma B factor antagonist
VSRHFAENGSNVASFRQPSECKDDATRPLEGFPSHCHGLEALLPDAEETNMALKMTNRRIVLGEESNALREKLKSLIAGGKKKIVLNMDNIKYIDSSGLGTLVAAHCSAKTQGASLRLCHLGSKFQEVLQITKLLIVFEVCDTEPTAVASFSK